MRARALRLTGAAALLVWLGFTAPLALGQRTLFMRDVFGIHLMLKGFGASELREGRVPAFMPSWALGVPYRGNPQALAFYPGNLLYLALPFWSAFNLHFALHWLLAAIAMWGLARGLGVSHGGALVAAITYAGSGVVLSAMTFYNVITVVAWWPLVLLGVARGGRRGVALGGSACGLALLGGEPVTAALGLAPLAALAWERHGLRRGAAVAAGIVGLGLLVALPQIVATARILPFTFRAGHGLEADQVGTYGFHLARLLELVIPLPFGWPGRGGPAGFWAAGLFERLPFYVSLHIGAIGLLLGLGAMRRRRLWAGLAGAGIALAWLGGRAPQLFVALSGGLFRYPEKLLFWFGLAAALLAGWGFDERRETVRWRAAEWAGGAALLLGGVVLGVRSGMLRDAAGPVRAIVAVQGMRWALALAISGALLVLAALAVRRRLTSALPLLQLAGLIQLWPLLPRIETAPFKRPMPWVARIAPATAVASPAWASPVWLPQEPMPRHPVDHAAALNPAPNLLFGLTYPTAPDFEGLASPLQTLLLRNLAVWGWKERAQWFRALGVEAAVLYSDPGEVGLEHLDRQRQPGFDARLYRVPGAAPLAWWPRQVVSAASPLATLGEVTRAADPVATVVVPRAVAHAAAGRVEVLEEAPDRIRLRVAGSGGLAVVRRSFHPLWLARAGDRRLALAPANLVLIGVEVPAGEHDVVLEVSAWPEMAAAPVAIVALVGAVAVAAGMGRPRRAAATSRELSRRPRR